MAAVYPKAVKKFSYRQDYTELVEAADVNVTYDEITAIQNNLGVLPNSDTIDGKLVTWPTVRDNIASSRRGTSHPMIGLNAHNVLIPHAVPTTISWTAVPWDTHGMFSSPSNVMCERTGLYTFTAYIRWHKDGLAGDNQQPVFNKNGKLEIAVQELAGDSFVTAQTGFWPAGFQGSIRQSATHTTRWTKGGGVNIQVWQSCLTTPITATVGFSVTFHRDPPTLNNM